jgi:pterin-4a-carbinolamine dehydratase
MASNWPKNESMMRLFDEKYRWKLSNLVIWFICTNGSVFIDLGLIKKYQFNVFEKAMKGMNLIHFLCKFNAYIDLERIVKAVEIAYFD